MTTHVGETGTCRIVDLGRTDSRFVVTASGHAVFVRNGTLVAQHFDMESRSLGGAPFPLVQDVAVYQPKDLMTVSLNGKPEVRHLATTQASEYRADISPDGRLVAYESTEAGGH